ncbi:MAG: STAS domain-containing protein [Oleispira sp.]|nr:STAS domain-containing protein [Oleispira sp.]
MSEQKFTISFSNDCCIYEVSVLQAQLSEAFNQHSNITLNLENVDYCDASFLQLLLSAHKQASLNDIKFSIESPAECVCQLANNLAFSELLYSD